MTTIGSLDLYRNDNYWVTVELKQNNDSYSVYIMETDPDYPQMGGQTEVPIPQDYLSMFLIAEYLADYIIKNCDAKWAKDVLTALKDQLTQCLDRHLFTQEKIDAHKLAVSEAAENSKKTGFFQRLFRK